MQGIELLGVLLLAGAALLVAVPMAADRSPLPHSALRIGIGLGAGLVGAIVVLVLGTDAIPDDVEAMARIPLVALVIAVVILLFRRGTGR